MLGILWCRKRLRPMMSLLLFTALCKRKRAGRCSDSLSIGRKRSADIVQRENVPDSRAIPNCRRIPPSSIACWRGVWSRPRWPRPWARWGNLCCLWLRGGSSLRWRGRTCRHSSIRRRRGGYLLWCLISGSIHWDCYIILWVLHKNRWLVLSYWWHMP